MKHRLKMVAAFAVAGFALGAAPLAANAASTNIGTGQFSRTTYNSRCEVGLNKDFCLWYSYSASESGIAYFAFSGTPYQIANLSGYTFGGGGTGNGQAVRNNAAAMDCTVFIPTKCTTYFSINYAGNSDYALWGYGGRLNQTWNNEASYKTS